jgi:transcriptional regulator with XRE-family HTH domain
MMNISDRIKFMRIFKNWTQEDMAEKLNMALSGYSKIERGETDIHFSRLQQIADIFDIELSYLIGLNEKNVLNMIESCNNHTNSTVVLSNIHISTTDAELKEQINKYKQLVGEQAKEISYLKEIIELMKKGSP